MPARAARDSSANAPFRSPCSYAGCHAAAPRPGERLAISVIEDRPYIVASVRMRRALRLPHPLRGQRDRLAQHVAKHGLLADPDVRGDRHPGDQVEVRRRAMQIDLDPG